jgi:hypothetical protein
VLTAVQRGYRAFEPQIFQEWNLLDAEVMKLWITLRSKVIAILLTVHLALDNYATVTYILVGLLIQPVWVDFRARKESGDLGIRRRETI